MIIIWLPRARTEREKAIDYIAEDSVSAALSQLAEVDAQIDLLAEFPEIGRIGRRRGTRELVITRTPFLAIYRVKPRQHRVEIVRFLHGAQQWPPRSKRQ